MDLSQKRLNQVLAWGTGVLTVFITPWFSYDPLNVPRMALLLVIASVIIFLSNSKLAKFWKTPQKYLATILIIFFTQIFFVVIFAPGNKVQQIFGTAGRQTGLLTYLALAIICFGAATASSTGLLRLIVIALAVAGSLSIGYGLIQAAGADPIGWTNPYSPVFGFFGNPNFQAAFMGFSAAAVSVFILSKKIKNVWKFSSATYVMSSLYIIYASKSQQGFLVFGIGLGVAAIIYVFKSSHARNLRIPTVIVSIFGVIAVTLDILQKSPWNSILYKPSVTFRGDYWRAGWQMSIEHPIFGVGLDSYRDWYFRSRDPVAASRSMSGRYIDSAHNVLLDLSASGGFPLLIVYVVMISLAFISAVKVFRRMQEFDVYFVAIFVVWVGYLAQSLISINQIGLAIWGWLATGLIIGYEINTRNSQSTSKHAQEVKKKIDNSASVSVKIAAGLVVGLALGLPGFLADANFRSSIDSRNVERISQEPYRWPQSVMRMNYVALLFGQNNLPDQALIVARAAVKFSPQTFESWKIIYDLPNTPPDEKARALEMMRKLNPLNPDQP